MDLVEDAQKGKLEHWKDDHDGRLAYLIVCDQFNRIINRKSERAYALDHRTRDVIVQMVT